MNSCESDHTSFSHLAHRFINSLWFRGMDLRGWKGEERTTSHRPLGTIINQPFQKHFQTDDVDFSDYKHIKLATMGKLFIET